MSTLNTVWTSWNSLCAIFMSCIVEKGSDQWPVSGSLTLVCQYYPCDSVAGVLSHSSLCPTSRSVSLFIFTLSSFASPHHHHCHRPYTLSQYATLGENAPHLPRRLKTHALPPCYLSEMSCLRCLKKGKKRYKRREGRLSWCKMDCVYSGWRACALNREGRKQEDMVRRLRHPYAAIVMVTVRKILPVAGQKRAVCLLALLSSLKFFSSGINQIFFARSLVTPNLLH